MKIAFNPSNSSKNILDLIKNNKDIIFDLKGHSIYARGVEFKGTDTNTWRPVVDNLTSNSATSSLSANQGRVLAGLINGKSDSDHNHDGRYIRKSGDTMLGALNFANGTWNLVGDDSYMGDCNISGHFGIKAANTTYPGIAFFNNASAFLGNLTAYSGNIKYGAYSLQFLDNGNTSVSSSTWTNPFSAYNSNAVADGQAICVWGQASQLSNLSTDTGDMSLWLKRVNAKVATLNMVLDGEYYANGNQRLAHVSEIPTSLKNPYALTISLNGTSQGPYDGSAAKNINITPSSIGAATSDHNHDGRYVYNYGGTQMDGASVDKNALGMTTNSGVTGDWWHILQAAWNGEYRWNSQIAFPTQNRNGMYYRSGLDDNTKWGSWVKLLDTNNYSGVLDSRYYTESEVNSLLDAKLNRQNLSYGTWNPRGYNLAADYFYNGGDLSISESGSQIHVSVDGYFWQNEGRYRVLDTSDVAGLKGDLTVHQYLSNTDTTWWPLIWGGSSHNNASDSTGAVYKSHDVLSWQTSSQTLYATHLRTTNLDTQTAIFHPDNDSTLKIYSGRTQDAVSDGHIGLQTSIDNTDGQTHVYPTQYVSRCVLALQPRGGSVYIGNMPNGGNGRKLNVNGDIGLFNTGSIRDLAIGGGIYWNPNVESATDGSDAASITLVKSGVAGGTTLVLSQMNDANDTIQFKTNTAARLYHNSYPILTTQNTYVSNHKGYINGTEITQVNNADTLDGAHLIRYGNGTGIKQVYYFNVQGSNASYIKLGTLNTVSVTGHGTSKVMFTVKGGINFGGTNESVYEVAASTRESIQVTSTLVRGNRELKFGYVSTSSNVEIWMAYDGTFRGVTEVEVSSSVSFTLAMTETTTKPSGFVEGSYRILASTADNVASATNAYHLRINSANTWSTWYQAGQSGQPSWLWGSNDGANMYVWNPSNFRVAYAASAGNADTVDGYHILPDSKQVYIYDYSVASPDGAWILIKFPAWNANNEIVAIDGWGDNRQAHCVVHCGSRYQGIWGYQSEYNGIAVKKIGWRLTSDVSKFAIVALIDAGITSLHVRATNTLEISKTTEDTTAFAINSNFFSSGGVFHGNVYSASKLTTARSIWGQSFDGTRDVNGTIYINNSNSENGAIILNNNVNTHARISAIEDQVVFNTGSALRFGGTEWEYSDWAGLKYDTVANTIYLGIADGTVFNYYSSKRSNGTLKLPGISSIDLNSGTSIRGLATNGSPYNSRVTLYDTSISLSAYGDISMSTGPGVIELTSGYNGIKLSCGQGAKANIGSDFKIEASRGVYLNQGNSGNVSLCQGGGKVGIGTTTPAYKLDVKGQVKASGFIHSDHSINDAVLLAGGGYERIFMLGTTRYYNNTSYELSFHKLSGLCNNLVWVDGCIWNSTSISFQLSSDFYPYRYANSPSMRTIYRMDGNNMITVDGNGIVIISCSSYPRRVGFFYTGRA